MAAVVAVLLYRVTEEDGVGGVEELGLDGIVGMESLGSEWQDSSLPHERGALCDILQRAVVVLYVVLGAHFSCQRHCLAHLCHVGGACLGTSPATCTGATRFQVVTSDA